MNKRTKGEILCTIGGISPLSIISCTPYGAANDSPLHLLWAIPMAILTLPLFPLYKAGEKIVMECDKEDFDKATAHLPRITLPADYSYIDNDRQDIPQMWYVIVNHYDDFHEFKTEKKAREWLETNGFQEVVALDYPDHLDTYWIK